MSEKAEGPFTRQPDVRRPLNGGIQYRFKFTNGFGASVVRHSFSYGSDAGLWELAVTDHKGWLRYDTPITDGVLGFLSVADVDLVLDKIAALTRMQEVSA